MGKNPQFWGPEIGNPVINKTANNSKTVRDREKIAVDHLQETGAGLFGRHCNEDGRNATPLETASSIK